MGRHSGIVNELYDLHKNEPNYFNFTFYFVWWWCGWCVTQTQKKKKISKMNETCLVFHRFLYDKIKRYVVDWSIINNKIRKWKFVNSKFTKKQKNNCVQCGMGWIYYHSYGYDDMIIRNYYSPNLHNGCRFMPMDATITCSHIIV